MMLKLHSPALRSRFQLGGSQEGRGYIPSVEYCTLKDAATSLVSTIDSFIHS